MSDKGMEAPDADAAEQERAAVPETAVDGAVPDLAGETPLEANQADAAEQGREVSPDEDEYR